MDTAYRPLRLLADYYNCECTLELLSNDVLRDKIRDLCFYRKGKKYSFYYCDRKDMFWFLKLTRRAEWVKVYLTAESIDEFQILLSDYFKLRGIPYTKIKNQKSKDEAKEKAKTKDYSDSVGMSFVLITIATIGVYAYRRYRSENPPS